MSIASLYPSINPSLLLDFANSKVLDPRITFTRTTSATYYDGVTTAKAEENLVLYSQEFDNSYWTKTDTTITANSATTAPDGTTTADLLYPNSTGIDRTVYRSSVSGLISTVYTFSFYARASGINWIYVGTFGGGTTPATCAFFDLQNGVVGQTGSFFTSATITSVGNSWYRCIVIGTTAIASIFPVIGLANANNSSTVTASGTNGVLLWGAQLEQRSSATAYTATTSQAITNYIPVLQTAAAGQARFDHNPTTGESLGLLIEEARTNLVTASQTFTTGWTAFNATVTNSAIIAPDGTLTGTKLTTTASTTFQGRYYIVSLSASTAYTFSIYAKAGEYSRLAVDSANIGQVPVALFDLSAGTVVSGTGTITPVGNGWYKCTATKTTTTGGSDYLAVYVNNGSSNSFAGNGFSGIFIWGAQLEAGSFATSYIPTTGSTATRNADAASMTGTNFSSWFNNGEGTFYSEAKYSSASQLSTIYVGDGTTANAIWIGKSVGGVSSPANGEMYVRAFSSNQGYPLTSSTVGTAFVKLCGVYKTNDFAFSGNGAAVATDTNGVVPVVDRLLIGEYVYTTEKSQTIKKIAYYPIRVTNTQLQSLTV